MRKVRSVPGQGKQGPPEGDEVTASRLLPQVGMMFRAFWAAPTRNVLLYLAAAIVLIVVATAYGQIRLNRWNEPFYDALSRRDLAEFIQQLGVFGIIAGALLTLNVAQRWLTEMTKLKLREGLTRDLIENWMRPGRAFRLASAGPIGINPDQRMHEDARHLTELSADLGIGLLQASILLVVFVKVLWVLSADFTFHFSGRSVAIPGYMVWAGILYAGSASLLSYWVGHNLIGRNADRYAREADLRFSLVRVNEHIDGIALAGGEGGEARHLEFDLSAVLAAMRRLVTGLTNLTWVTAGYGWFTVVAPIFVAAPLYFAGDLTFGGLMMAAAAFTQVQASLRWFVDNFSTIADWRATLLRVANFRQALTRSDVLHGATSHIVFEQGPPRKMTIEGLEIASPAGCTMLQESSVEVKGGERVLIVGEPGVGKTLLFRALAGLWPWGAGRIAWPKGEAVAYVPRKPYLPPGTLGDALAYPQKVDNFTAQAFADALGHLGLQHLVPMLALSKRWDLELSDDEQQGVVFARLLIHAPRWVLIDNVLESLEEETRARAFEVISKDLKDAAVIYIGRTEREDDAVFARVLHLVKNPTMRRLVRKKATEVHAPAPGSRAASNS